jgi:hypothetical protein
VVERLVKKPPKYRETPAWSEPDRNRDSPPAVDSAVGEVSVLVVVAADSWVTKCTFVVLSGAPRSTLLNMEKPLATR